MRVLASDGTNLAILRVICDPCAYEAVRNPEPGVRLRFSPVEGSEADCALCPTI